MLLLLLLLLLCTPDLLGGRERIKHQYLNEGDWMCFVPATTCLSFKQLHHLISSPFIQAVASPHLLTLWTTMRCWPKWAELLQIYQLSVRPSRCCNLTVLLRGASRVITGDTITTAQYSLKCFCCCLLMMLWCWSLWYVEIFTLTLVVGRTVSIDAYLSALANALYRRHDTAALSSPISGWWLAATINAFIFDDFAKVLKNSFF